MILVVYQVQYLGSNTINSIISVALNYFVFFNLVNIISEFEADPLEMGWSATIFVVLSGIFYVCLCDDKMRQCSAQQMVALTENYLKYAVVSECIWSMSLVSSSHLDAGNMKRIGMMLMTTVQPLCKVSQIIKTPEKIIYCS